jgi:ubiquinone/menaquinone biosynthesis C-methylase UbiE
MNSFAEPRVPSSAAEREQAVFADGKTEALAAIIRERIRRPIRRLLVVGCGSGVEAAVLGQALEANVVGIDVESASFDAAAAACADLRRGDATCLEFEDESFDFAFSYHALEHIPAYQAALAEMARVLTPGGAYCVGTPNRHRLVGYVGSKEANWREIIVWNAVDWNARLHGRFRNEYGAHAGFSSRELKTALEAAFHRADEITLPYYQRVYARYGSLMTLIGRCGLGPIAFPSVYFLGAK